MSQLHPVKTQAFQEGVEQTLSQHTPMVLSCRMETGWATHKLFLLHVDQQQKELVLEYPNGNDPIELIAGQEIGLSFRKGHKKYVFDATVIGRENWHISPDGALPALRVSWPSEVFELQRRVYRRVTIPSQMKIPVYLWKGDTQQASSPDGRVYHGRIVDISAGGISLQLANPPADSWKENEPMVCEFAPSRSEPTVKVNSCYRHRLTDQHETCRIGLQFVGLDATDHGRDKLERILQMVSRLRRIKSRR